MGYKGRVVTNTADIQRQTITGSTSATHTLTTAAKSAQQIQLYINGVKQHDSAYTLSNDTTLVLASALVATDEMEIITFVDVGTTMIPSDGSVTSAKIGDDAVTADKLASGLANATHTGDVTGSTALTIAVDAVDIPMLSATGTADATTFLRGDNSWAVPGGGKGLQVVTATYDTATTMSSTSYASTGLSCSITPASASNKVLILYSGMCRVWANSAASGRWVTTAIYRVTDTTVLTEQTTKEVNVSSSTDQGWAWSQCFSTLDSPSTTSSVEYRIDGKVNNASVHRSTYQNEGSDSTLTLLEIEG